MVQERWKVVWERSRAGRHTVVIGPDTLPLAPSDLQVLCVRCDAPDTSGGVLDAAQRRVAQRLGEEVPAPEPGRARFEQGLRQRFLGDMPGPSLDARLVEACNRLADQTAGRTVLAFEAIDAADEATIATLAQILQRPGWLRLPLLLTARSTPQGRGAELAETEHLLARLPLHVQVPPGWEEEAYARGLEHARAAEGAYQHLGQHDKLARVWETMGRLALQHGHREAAQERLTAALTLQQQRGDVAGLARSTAALAELCMTAGHLGDAVALLADSITLNFEKGSPIGLAFNRQTLGALTKAATQAHGPDAEQLRGAVADVESRLAQAEAVLGRVGLPGEAGGPVGVS